MARRVMLWAMVAMIVVAAAPAMASPADWQAAVDKAAVAGAPPAVDVAGALAAGPDDANYWLAVGLTVRAGADADYWLPVLLNGQAADGTWGSALATAGAVLGLDAANESAYASQIAAGADALAAAQKADGSWAGDASDAYVVLALNAALKSAGVEAGTMPTVAISAPVNGACMAGTAQVTVTATATDVVADPIVRFQTKFDGVVLSDVTYAGSLSVAGGGVTAVVLPFANGVHTAFAAAWDSAANFAPLSSTIFTDATAPDLAALDSFTPSVNIGGTVYVSGQRFTDFLGNTLVITSLSGRGRDAAGGCGIASLTFRGDKTQVGINVGGLPPPVALTVPNIPKWQVLLGAPFGIPAPMFVSGPTTANNTMRALAQSGAAGVIVNYNLSDYEIQTRPDGWNIAPAATITAPYLDMDQSLNVLGISDAAIPDCPGPPIGVTAATMRGITEFGDCSIYATAAAFKRYWPVRGRYPANLSVLATDATTPANTLASAMTPVVVVVPIFDDVPMTDWAWDNIERIRNYKVPPRNENVTLGSAIWPASALPLKRSYAPNAFVSRGQMAAFIMRSLGQSGSATQRFNDVPTGAAFFTDINGMWERGVSVGCTTAVPPAKPNYCPNASVTRAQMVTFMLRALGEAGRPATTQIFSDVAASHWAFAMVQEAAGAAPAFDPPGDGTVLTTGCKTIGTTRYFCPDDGTSRREMAVFLCRAFPVPLVANGPADPW